MWSFYDTLISAVSGSDAKIKDFIIGTSWTAVITEDGVVGLAPSIYEKWQRFEFTTRPEPGMSVSELAPAIKSWNYYEAALGLACINAVFNRNENVTADAVVHPGGRRSRGAFLNFCEKNTRDTHSVMIEPIYDREEMASAPGIIDIVRRETSYRDYMANAYEELVPAADQLIIGGTSIVDKLAAPALSFASGKKKFAWGMDVPLTTAFADFGIKDITGFIVDDPEKCIWTVKRSGTRDEIIRLGHFVTVSL